MQCASSIKQHTGQRGWLASTAPELPLVVQLCESFVMSIRCSTRFEKSNEGSMTGGDVSAWRATAHLCASGVKCEMPSTARIAGAWKRRMEKCWDIELKRLAIPPLCYLISRHLWMPGLFVRYDTFAGTPGLPAEHRRPGFVGEHFSFLLCSKEYST